MCSVKELYSCQLCDDEVSNNYLVICPFCSVEICESCFQYSIVMELKNPICIYCKKNFSLEFVLENNDTEWCKKIFIPYFENLCLEKEKSYLIDTMPKYKKILQIRELRKEINKLPSNKKIERQAFLDFKTQYSNTNLSERGNSQQLKDIKNNEIFLKLLNDRLCEKRLQKEKLYDEIFLLEGKEKTSEREKKTIYICNCPNDKCRGFITDDYNCELCHLEICQLCMVEKMENHNCKRDDIESSQLIKDSSKPCPKCYVPIFKISGCPQMFCTNCHVVFDWNTLQIDRGNVHNAHYFDWIVSQNQGLNVNLEEVACGDILEIYRNLIFKYRSNNTANNNYYSSINKIRRTFEVNRIFHGEIIPHIRDILIRNKFEGYRIEYLDNKLSEKSWKSKIAKDKISNEKYNSLIEVFEMYVTVTSDFIRQLAFNNTTFQEFSSNYNKFYSYFCQSIDEILQIFGGNLTKRQYNVVESAKI